MTQHTEARATERSDVLFPTADCRQHTQGHLQVPKVAIHFLLHFETRLDKSLFSPHLRYSRIICLKLSLLQTFKWTFTPEREELKKKSFISGLYVTQRILVSNVRPLAFFYFPYKFPNPGSPSQESNFQKSLQRALHLRHLMYLWKISNSQVPADSEAKLICKLYRRPKQAQKKCL